jgi:hypothetical protein
LKIFEAGIGNGDVCGAVAIDQASNTEIVTMQRNADTGLFQAFLVWLEQRIGKQSFGNVPLAKRCFGSTFMSNFESAKHRFTGLHPNTTQNTRFQS